MPAVKKVVEKTICPLFEEAGILASAIGKVTISRVVKPTSTNKSGRVVMAKEEYFIDGNDDELFEIDTYRTTEQDLQEQFGGGTYWLAALDPVTSRAIFGRNVTLNGPRTDYGTLAEKGEDALTAEPAPPEEEEKPAPAPPPNPFAGQMVFGPQEMMAMMKDLLRTTQDSAKDRIDAVKESSKREASMYTTFAERMIDQRRQPDDVITELRSQLDELRKKATRDEDALRQSHRDELSRRDRADEEHRRLAREELSRRDKDVDELRRKFSDELDERKKRGERGEDEVRRQWRDEVTHIKATYDRELTTALGRVRELEKSLYELQKENLELAKELAQSTDEPPPPPTLGPGGRLPIPADAPAWMQVANMVGGEKIAEVGGRIVDRLATAFTEPGRPAAPPQYAPIPQQFQPQFQPQFSPQPGAQIPPHFAPAPMPPAFVPQAAGPVPVPMPAVSPPPPLADSLSAVRPLSFGEPAMGTVPSSPVASGEAEESEDGDGEGVAEAMQN